MEYSVIDLELEDELIGACIEYSKVILEPKILPEFNNDRVTITDLSGIPSYLVSDLDENNTISMESYLKLLINLVVVEAVNFYIDLDGLVDIDTND